MMKRVPRHGILLPALALALLPACGKKEAVPEPQPPAALPEPGATAKPAPSRVARHDAARRRPDGGGIEFHRGRFSQQFPGNDGLPSVQRLGPLPEESKAELQRLITQANTHPTKEEAVRMIDQARDFHSTEVFPLIEALLRHPDAEVRGGALSMLQGMQDEKALPVAAAGLKDTDPEVRLQAVEATARITSPEVVPVLKAALQDPDLSVRQLAFQNALRQNSEPQAVLIGDAVRSSYPDLAEAALGALESQPSPTTVTYMMDALSNSSPAIREKAHDTLYLIFHEDFPGTAQAKGWWLQNQRRYDENLVLKAP